MVSVDKFYIYGGGRWREVDPGSGRIDGWGRAKFLVARGGKLQATRSQPVLAALRALAHGQPSAAAPGPDLPHKYSAQRRASRESRRAGCEHCQCCHHNHNTGSSCASKTNNKATVAIQCDNLTNQPTLQAHTSERKRDSTSSEDTLKIPNRKRDSTSSEDFQKVTTVATVHSPRKAEQKRRNSKSFKKCLKRKRQSSNSDSEFSTLKPKTSSRLKLRRPGPLKRKRSSSKESSVILTSTIERRQNKITKFLSPKSKKVLNYTSDGSPKRITRQNVSLVISSDDSDFENVKSKVPRIKRDLKKAVEISSTDEPAKHKVGPKRITDVPIKRKIDPKRALDRSSRDEPIKHKRTTDDPIKHVLCPERSIFSRRVKPETPSPKITQDNTSKELLIDERDVEILRLFLQKYYPDEELRRFDTDDEYKKMHFYRINPLVNVERCPRIARMIRADSQDTISLVDFASKLGLRSVSETSSKTKRYKTRRQQNISYINSDSDAETESTDAANKENIRTDKTLVSNKIVGTNKVLKESLNKLKGRDQTKRDIKKNDVKESDDLKQRSKTRDKLRNVSETRENDKDKLQEYSNKSERERGKNSKRDKLRSENSKTKENNNNTEGVKSRREPRGIDKKREIDNTVDTVEMSSDSDADVRINGLKIVEVQKPLLNKPKAKPTISTKRVGLKEYSNLEDHAIVSWVSSGGRASQVNGNRLWRQLQDQFCRITGRGRTWHSLRNRYLRYILPRLGALALPPALQARLRAAAATGSLKARKREPRRNSMFAQPAQGASSRRLPLRAEVTPPADATIDQTQVGRE